jgi:hypothetical protein
LSDSPPSVVITKSPDYRTIPVSHIFTALIETEGKLLVFTNKLEVAIGQDGKAKLGKVIRELQVELHFSPQEFKEVANLMVKVVKDFEERHKTKIKSIKEKEKPLYS